MNCLHAELETSQYGVGLEMPNTGHLACHTEATYAALLCTIAQTQTAATVGVNEIGNKALFTQLDLA
jgi:hypothetical protein